MLVTSLCWVFPELIPDGSIHHRLLLLRFTQAWGHSLAVGPFAEVLASCDEKPTIVYADLDFTQVESCRAIFNL